MTESKSSKMITWIAIVCFVAFFSMLFVAVIQGSELEKLRNGIKQGAGVLELERTNSGEYFKGFKCASWARTPQCFGESCIDICLDWKDDRNPSDEELGECIDWEIPFPEPNDKNGN